MKNPLRWLDNALADLESQTLLRRLSARTGAAGVNITIAGTRYLNFGSNDYLDLASDPRLGAAAAAAARDIGWGAGASPLVTGRTELHERLEARLAEFEGTEAALLFNTGYAANVGAVAALVGPDDAVFSDSLNHASLIDGCRLSRAKTYVIRHGDCTDLEAQLKNCTARRRLIVTDSLFSMDGDLAPLPELCDLAERYDGMLLADEAHATGVFGRTGRGAAEHFGVEGRVPIRVGTLSKALGASGGFVAGSRQLIDWLANRARTYVFSTAPPPSACAAALAALDIVRDEPARRQRVLGSASTLRERLVRAGLDIGPSASQIVPVILGGARRAVAVTETLRRRGLWVPAIRPPSVPDGQSRLRISLTAGHTEEMLEALVDAFTES